MLKSLLRCRSSMAAAAVVTKTSSAWSWNAPAIAKSFHTSFANHQAAAQPSTPPTPTPTPSDASDTTLSSLVGKYGWLPVAGLGSVIALSKELLILDEEILVLGTFAVTVYALYSQIGGSVSSYLDERAKKIEQEMTTVMDESVKEIDAQIEANSSVLNLSDEINALYTHQIELVDRYVKAMPQKLQSEITRQVERRLALLAEKEQAVVDSMQNTLADGAAQHVHHFFETASASVKSQIMRQSIQQIASTGKGTKASADDPVRDQFFQYFQGFSKRVKENSGKKVPLTNEQQAEWLENLDDLVRRDPALKDLKVDVPSQVTLS